MTSDGPDRDTEQLFDLLARDLGGELGLAERRQLFARLAAREDAGALIGRALALEESLADLRAVYNTAQPPADFAATVIARAFAEAPGVAASRAAEGERPSLWRRLLGGGLLNGSGDAAPGERLSGDQLAQIVAGQGEKNEDDLKPPPVTEDPAAEDAAEDDTGASTPGDGADRPQHKPDR